MVESYGLQTLCECRERPQTSIQEKITVLEKTLACMANDDPILAHKRVLEKELEKHQKKLNGPQNTAKHIEAKQNWINRESKRIEAEGAKLAEMQSAARNFESGLRGDQDSWRGPVARGRIDRQKTGATSCLWRTQRKFESSNNKNWPL